MTRIRDKRSICLAAILFWGASFPIGLAQTNPPARPVEVSLKAKEGDLLVSGRINNSRLLAFKLDTGFGITTISPEVAESLQLQRAGGLTIDGIAGEERAATFRNAELDFAGMIFRPRRVAALPSDKEERKKDRDGILGADFFRRFIVELDVAARVMRLYEPSEFKYAGAGEVIPLRFKRDTPIVEGTIVTANHEIVNGRFEIDTGCDDALCLGQDFVAANRLLDKAKPKPRAARRGVGGSTPVQHGALEELRLGKLIIKKPSTNFFLEGSPAGKGQAGHIGLGALQRFKMIFDYSRQQMILEPRA